MVYIQYTDFYHLVAGVGISKSSKIIGNILITSSTFLYIISKRD